MSSGRQKSQMPSSRGQSMSSYAKPSGNPPVPATALPDVGPTAMLASSRLSGGDS